MLVVTTDDDKHFAHGCTLPPKCAKCSGAHSFDQCTSATIRCANCHSHSHMASSTSCPNWLGKLQIAKHQSSAATHSDLEALGTKIDEHFENLKSHLHQKLHDMGSALLKEIVSVIGRDTEFEDQPRTETLRDILHESNSLLDDSVLLDRQIDTPKSKLEQSLLEPPADATLPPEPREDSIQDLSASDTELLPEPSPIFAANSDDSSVTNELLQNDEKESVVNLPNPTDYNLNDTFQELSSQDDYDSSSSYTDSTTTEDSENGHRLDRLVRKHVSEVRTTREKDSSSLMWMCEAIVDTVKMYTTDEDKMAHVLATLTPEYIKTVTGNSFEGDKYLLFKTGVDIVKSAVKVLNDDPNTKIPNEEIHVHLSKPWRDLHKENAISIWTEAVLHRRDGFFMWEFIGFYGLPDEIRQNPNIILTN